MFSSKWPRQEQINQKFDRNLQSVDQSLQKNFGNVRNDVLHLEKWIQFLNQNQQQMGTKMNSLTREVRSLTSALHQIDAQTNKFMTTDQVKAAIDHHYSIIENLSNRVYQSEQRVHSSLSSLQTTQQHIFSQLRTLSLAQQQQEGENISLIKREIDQVMSSKIDQREESLIGQVQELLRQKLSSVVTKDELFTRLEELAKTQEKAAPVALQQPVQTQPAPSTKSQLQQKIYRKVARQSKEYVKSMLRSLIKKYGRISGLSLREMVVEDQQIVSKSSFYRLLGEVEHEEEISVIHEGKEKHYLWSVASLH